MANVTVMNPNNPQSLLNAMTGRNFEHDNDCRALFCGAATRMRMHYRSLHARVRRTMVNTMGTGWSFLWLFPGGNQACPGFGWFSAGDLHWVKG